VVTDFIEDNLDWETQEFAAAGFAFKTHQLKHESEDDLIRATQQAEVIVVNMAKITPRVVQSWKRCRLVIRHGIGYDNVDVPALTQAGIPLVNIPDYCVEEVAEHAIALVLNAARKVTVSQKILNDSITLGRWDFRAAVPIHRMKDQQLGIIGCGRIGSRVYQKLSHFGFKLVVCDPYLSEERRKSLGVHIVSLEQLLATSDFVTLHAPLNTDTRRMINAETLRLMKSTAYLVNTARAGLIDHEALVVALEQGAIAGAALDVFETEPPIPSDPLLRLENVVLTPHLSWYSVESEWSIRRSIVAIVNEFAAGIALNNVVNATGLGEMT
jgi:D-3-phosphoglycerate dehydrogenase